MRPITAFVCLLLSGLLNDSGHVDRCPHGDLACHKHLMLCSFVSFPRLSPSPRLLQPSLAHR